MAKIVLGYWDLRGKVEPIRYLLHYKDVDFEDKRYHLEEGVWQKEKFSLNLDFPNLPYYFDEDVKLTQSLTILRYLADKYDLDGNTKAEKLRVMLAEQQIGDMREYLRLTCAHKEFENIKEEYLRKARDQFELLSSFLGDRKFLAGDGVTYVDFTAYEVIDYHYLLSKTLLDEFPNLKAYQERIRNLPGLQDYIQSPSYKRWPIFGPYVVWGGSGEEPK